MTNFGPNRLYHNNGDGTFTDVTVRARVGDGRWGTSAAFADYDTDGNLDLFVVNYVKYQLETNPACHQGERRVYCPPADFEGVSDILYRNCGDGTFIDVTEVALNPDGIGETGLFAETLGKGLGVAWGDYDNDGDLDIFITNSDDKPDLLRNDSPLQTTG